MSTQISVLILMITKLLVIRAYPQLDLPPLTTPLARPDIVFNSYTPKNGGNSLNYEDANRSDRFGPPYADDGSDDRGDDFRNGQPYDDRQRYGLNYPNMYLNRSSDSPYSRDEPYRDREYLKRNNDQDQFTTRKPYNPNDQYTSNRDPNRGYQDDRYQPNRFNSSDRYNLNNDQINEDRYRFEQERRSQIEMEKLRNFVVETDHQGSQECTENVAAQWNFETNVNDFTQNEALLAQRRYAEYQRRVAEQSKRIDRDLIFDRKLYRQLQLLSEAGPNSLPFDQLDRYNRLINEMLVLYNEATICAYQQPFQCGLRYYPNLRDIMSESRDWGELEYTWTEYHRKAGREMRDSYKQLIDVMNEVAMVNNMTDGGQFWYMNYESGSFHDDLELVWEEIRPFYELLHAYVRRKLREYYGPEKISRDAPIPEHILGNMFGQSWMNILDIIIPYPGRTIIDVSERMKEFGFSPAAMYRTAEDFFTSINFTALGPEFYSNSIFQQPFDRVVLCEPSAWDFCNRHDYRIKMCANIDQKSLISVHHEMAHIHYFLAYRHQPKVFRNGANPAFHQAIGDAITLSVSTLKHLQTIGLIQRSVDDYSYDINYLFTMALDKVAFLPFALALDNWRYDLYSGRTKKDSMNCHFWDLRERYGGVKPPRLRSEKDFDAGAKYHIPANIPYIKYFVSTVLQFQIYRAMCKVSKQYDPSDPNKPLHKCDIYRQPEAGNLLKRLMEKGSSQPWQQVLDEVLGEGRLDGSALREYFQPLSEWLRLENIRNQEYVGWTYDGDYCKRSIETANLQIFGGFYNDSPPRSELGGLILLAIVILKHFF
ncbi:angiotensin-converting enzyme isoform X1 [Eupeodes corollae]|uniref:angiotensin-converting enzyme isoform X1 n=1 Tax=Eupeodes corollae TaxID=290404 RepID=UPI0024929FD8|nr:angiotensin-converting enzyme isoform X1 [Eupeodes corollae]